MGENIVEEEIKGISRWAKKFWNYVTSEDLWELIFVESVKILLIICLSFIVVFVGKRVIARIFKLRMKAPIKQNERRQQTLLKLLQSVLLYIVYFSAIIGVLSVLEINVAGLLAGAGVVGLAIGFGAQSLVKDIITGFFIIFEDQFGVGDYIKLNTAEGTVTEIGLRTTKILGITGEQFIIPNGQILEVINYSINNSKAIVDMQVGLDANIEQVEKLVTDYLKTLPHQYEELVGVPNFLGVQNVVGIEVTIRMIAETKPLQHYAIARVIRRDVKDILDKNGIPMAYPKMMLYDQSRKRSGEDGA